MSAKKFEIQQVRSTARCIQAQIDTMKSLGLRRIRHSVVREDSPQLQGMLRVVNHLVSVKEVQS